jgi:hypothetical protein
MATLQILLSQNLHLSVMARNLEAFRYYKYQHIFLYKIISKKKFFFFFLHLYKINYIFFIQKKTVISYQDSLQLGLMISRKTKNTVNLKKSPRNQNNGNPRPPRANAKE